MEDQRKTLIPTPPNKIRTLAISRFPPKPKCMPYRHYLLRATDDPKPIAFVFNSTLICDDAASAQAVTFARYDGVRSVVTLYGDVYESSGMMSGGAVPSGSAQAQELRSGSKICRG